MRACSNCDLLEKHMMSGIDEYCLMVGVKIVM